MASNSDFGGTAPSSEFFVALIMTITRIVALQCSRENSADSGQGRTRPRQSDTHEQFIAKCETASTVRQRQSARISRMNAFDSLLAPLEGYPHLLTALQLMALIVIVWLANTITRRVLLRLISRSVKLTSTQFDDALLGRGVIARLANVVPALVAYYGINFVTGLPESVTLVVRGVAIAYVVLTIALSLSNLLNAIGAIYEQRDPERARTR